MDDLFNFIQPVVDELPTVFWICDKDGNLIYISKKWMQITGQTKPHDKEWLEKIHYEDRPELLSGISDTSDKNVELTVRIISSDDQVRWYHCRGERKVSREGAEVVSGLFSLCENAREQQHENLDNKLHHKKEELKRVKSDLDGFIYTASHDLKAPIANIEALLNLLKGTRPGTEDFGTTFNHIDTSLKKFKNTLQDLSDLAKASTDEVDNKAEYVCVRELLDEVLESISVSVNQSEVDIQVQLEVEEIFFQKKSLRSILYNLISNCIKYRHPDRQCKVSVKTWKEGQDNILLVRDNGIGIPKKSQQEMFQPFRRFHDHVEGTGIGLYIIKRLVDKAGGDISASSKEGEGTEFVIKLPDRVDEPV